MTRKNLVDDDAAQYDDILGRLKRLEQGSSQAALCTIATKPAATDVSAGKLIFVSDAADGQRFQGSDGTNWKTLG